MFPDIKVGRGAGSGLVKRLQADLRLLKDSIIDYAPGRFDSRRLENLRFRIFKFPKSENCNEYFATARNKKYVCLNSTSLKRNYYFGLQHALHGIAHSFCFLRDGVAEEIFAEFVSYSVLNKFLIPKGEFFSRRVIKRVMNASKREYNTYYRIGRKLEKKRPNFLIKLNTKAKNKKISKVKEKRIFYKLLKYKFKEDKDEKIPNLERGFKKI